MIISNVSQQDIEQALETVNKQYNNNIMFNNFTRRSNTGKSWIVTIRAKDSKAPGARTSWNGRRTVAACWHAYGIFMDALPKHARIFKHLGMNIDRTHNWTSPGDPWQDFNVGSIAYPRFISDLCEC